MLVSSKYTYNVESEIRSNILETLEMPTWPAGMSPRVLALFAVEKVVL